MKEITVDDPRAVANFVRMNAHRFQYLLDTVSPLIVDTDTAMRDAIPPAECLATLRFSINVWLGFNYYRLYYTY